MRVERIDVGKGYRTILCMRRGILARSTVGDLRHRTALHRRGDHWNVVRAGDGDRNRRRRFVAIAISDLVTEGIRHCLARSKTLDGAMRVVQCIGVAAVSAQNQRTELADRCATNHARRVARRYGRDRRPVCPPHVLDTVRTIGIRATRAGQYIAIRNEHIIFGRAIRVRCSRRNVVGDRDGDGAFGLVAVRVGSDDLDRAECGEIVGIDAGMAGIVVGERRRHGRAVAAAHQVEGDDGHAAGLADDLGVGDPIPGQRTGEGTGVAEHDGGDGIRTGHEADRAAAGVGARRAAVGQVLVVECKRCGSRKRIDCRAGAVRHGDRLAVAGRVVVGILGRQREADIDSARIVEVAGRCKRPGLVGIDRQRTLGKRKRHRLARRQRLRRVADRHVDCADAIGTCRKRPAAGKRLAFHHARRGRIGDPDHRNVVDDIDLEGGRTAGTIVIGDREVEDVPVLLDIRAGIDPGTRDCARQLVGVLRHTGKRVVAGDGQCTELTHNRLPDETADGERLTVDGQASDVVKPVRIGEGKHTADRRTAIARTRSDCEAGFVDLPVAHRDAAWIIFGVGGDRRVIVGVKREGQTLGRFKRRKLQGGRGEQVDDRPGLADVAGRIGEIPAAALVRHDADGAIRARGDVDTVFSKHRHEGFAGDFGVTDDEGRNFQCGVLDRDCRAIRLF